MRAWTVAAMALGYMVYYEAWLMVYTWVVACAAFFLMTWVLDNWVRIARVLSGLLMGLCDEIGLHRAADWLCIKVVIPLDRKLSYER